MKETLLIKHAVGGRTFLDSHKQACEYRVEETKTGWKVQVKKTFDANIAEILKWKDELNLFLFQEEPGKPILKIWFYVHSGPVTYDHEAGELTVVADSRIAYIPDSFGSSV